MVEAVDPSMKRFQISLRTLVLAVAIISCGLAWFGTWLRADTELDRRQLRYYEAAQRGFRSKELSLREYRPNYRAFVDQEVVRLREKLGD
jgi:hypothetical protein